MTNFNIPDLVTDKVKTEDGKASKSVCNSQSIKEHLSCFNMSSGFCQQLFTLTVGTKKYISKIHLISPM